MGRWPERHASTNAASLSAALLASSDLRNASPGQAKKSGAKARRGLPTDSMPVRLGRGSFSVSGRGRIGA